MHRKIIVIIISFSIFCGFTLNTSAIETEFDFSPLGTNDKESFLANVLFSKVGHSAPVNPIECFDVNNNGIVAIGHSNYSNKTITFLSSDGTVLGGISFHSSGDIYVKWKDNKNLLVYFVRSDYIVSLTQECVVSEVYAISTSSEKYNEWRKTLRSTTREINGSKYELSNDSAFLNMFASSYSQLIVTSSEGNEQILYDASSLYLERVVVGFVAVCFFTIIVTFVVIRLFITNKNKET